MRESVRVAGPSVPLMDEEELRAAGTGWTKFGGYGGIVAAEVWAVEGEGGSHTVYYGRNAYACTCGLRSVIEPCGHVLAVAFARQAASARMYQRSNLWC